MTATDEINGICLQVKSQAEAMANQTFTGFTAVSYRTKLVQGTLYLIKVRFPRTRSCFLFSFS